MTTSANDSEALVAMRKANALLASAGWDWPKLIAGKIKVVADPFASVPTPTNTDWSPRTHSAPHSAPPRPQPPQRPPQRPMPPHDPAQWGSAPSPPPRPQPAPQSTAKVFQRVPINAKRPNAFPGHCYCCGDEVPANAGLLFHPSNFTAHAPVGFKVVCIQCNARPNTTIPSKARRPRVVKAGASTMNIGDLA